ncbi:MAG: hypothetical protein ACLQAN_01265 [Acidimicrobiales bacterium]
MNEEPAPLAGLIIARARVDVERLAAAGRWTAENTAELDRVFERSATRALRRPRFAERSLMLRRIARRVVPAPARPYLRRVLASFEGPRRVLGARRDR